MLGEHTTVAPPATATSHSPDRNDRTARCKATNDDEQAVSIVKAGPCVVIQRKTLVEIQKLIGDQDVIIEFGRDENHLFFGTGNKRLVSRILAGQFPNYELVVPRDNDKFIISTTRALGDGIRRAAVMSDEKLRAIRLSFKSGALELTASCAEAGEADIFARIADAQANHTDAEVAQVCAPSRFCGFVDRLSAGGDGSFPFARTSRGVRPAVARSVRTDRRFGPNHRVPGRRVFGRAFVLLPRIKDGEQI